jgi:predicted HAD superfamily Cof-like phosphohydrolase
MSETIDSGCPIGRYCDLHEVQHGQEAEELRERFEGIALEWEDLEPERAREIRYVLDTVDARDSAGYLEARMGAKVAELTRRAEAAEKERDGLGKLLNQSTRRAEAAEKERDALAAEVERLTKERDEAQRRVTELQTRMTEMVESQLHRRVATFYAEVVGRPFAGGPPRVPPADELRAKLRLVHEEFMEIVFSAGYDVDENAQLRRCDGLIGEADLVGIADACADLMYVVQGFALACGIHLPPVIDEVHRSNMAKVGGALDANGKFRKPPGWTPPDIERVLREQGWKP